MSENNGLATAEQARAAGSRQTRRYKLLDPLPVSGLRFRIQSLTERELAEHDAEATDYARGGFRRSALTNANARIFVRTLVDAEGNRLFADNDVKVFADWDAADTNVLFDECARHCGIRRANAEDLGKNSETTSVADSPSSSPSE